MGTAGTSTADRTAARAGRSGVRAARLPVLLISAARAAPQGTGLRGAEHLEDLQAAGFVRSVAHGDETAPPVSVAGEAMVDLPTWRVLAVVVALPPSALPPVDREAPWRGLFGRRKRM